MNSYQTTIAGFGQGNTSSSEPDRTSKNSGSNGGGSEVAPKSRACALCARMKMKCTWPSDTGAPQVQPTCSRCTRMKLRCHMPEPTHRKKRGKSTRVAALEQKIDGIVSLLSAQKQPGAGLPLTPESSLSCHQPAENAAPPDELLDPCGPGLDSRAEDFVQAVPGFSLSFEQADECLDTYRTLMTPNFPFVPIMPSITAYELYSQDRFLFWTIMHVTAPQTLAVQNAMRLWFRQYLALHMVVNQEKRLGMLQAILLAIGWGNFQFYIDTQATNLLQLARALVIDLNLNQPLNTGCLVPKSLLADSWLSLSRGRLRERVPYSLDEHRAVLGYYYITSVVSLLFRRIHLLPWNRYLAQSCDALLEDLEFESDAYLVAIVKMQRIASRIETNIPDPLSDDPVSLSFRASQDMIMATIRKDLKAFVDLQPDKVKRHPLLWAHYHGILVRLCDAVTLMGAPLPSETDFDQIAPFRRIETRWACLNSAKDFFDAILAIPAQCFPDHPFTVVGLVGFAIVTVARLLLMENSPEWDPTIARRKMDLADITRRISEKLEEADNATLTTFRRRRSYDEDSPVLLKYSFKMRWIGKWYLTKLPQEQQAMANSSSGNETALPDFTGMPDMANCQFDEALWQELMPLEALLNAALVPDPVITMPSV